MLARIATPVLAIALIATVVTQILYISTGISATPGAQVLWRSEAVLFLVIALFGFAWMRAAPLVAGGLVLGGLINLLQVAIGLLLFGAFEGAQQGAVVGLAFVFYYAGKIAFSFAALAIGFTGLAGAGWSRIASWLALLAGVAGLAINLYALAGGSAMFVAGAAGTAATFALALSLGAHGMAISRIKDEE